MCYMCVYTLFNIDIIIMKCALEGSTTYKYCCMLF